MLKEAVVSAIETVTRTARERKIATEDSNLGDASRLIRGFLYVELNAEGSSRQRDRDSDRDREREKDRDRGQQLGRRVTSDHRV